ncbi:GyrI-like domain-containing protein [Solitalea sp. MAHUQ-68]|uniref:GyrI-like domain-containing protein n=2 Tax=Sphingobacteriaceae TaxID=84566 RepID=A0A9X2JD35_9SPHI|nr:GyrI-like domain-containing protein [Solitalea agri]
MSLIENRTGELWRSFMQKRKEISTAINNDLISMQVYNASYSFENFNPGAIFEKWAAVEVTDFNQVPDGMETFLLEEGLYAVFLHKGAASTGAKTFQYIFGVWLPQSGYTLDNRPHFEVLGEKYKNEDPESEEEIWIPIKAKKKD